MPAEHRALRNHYDVARYQVDLCGGVVTTAGLAERWGVTRTRVFQLRKAAGFPQPIPVEGGPALYFAHECDAWRKQRAAA